MPESPAARRRDVEGLRALAVLLVVTYHVWLGRVSGGVDVFLLVSAFFLTGGLVRRLDAGVRVCRPRGSLEPRQDHLVAWARAVGSGYAVGP